MDTESGHVLLQGACVASVPFFRLCVLSCPSFVFYPGRLLLYVRLCPAREAAGCMRALRSGWWLRLDEREADMGAVRGGRCTLRCPGRSSRSSRTSISGPRQRLSKSTHDVSGPRRRLMSFSSHTRVCASLLPHSGRARPHTASVPTDVSDGAPDPPYWRSDDR